MAILLVRLASLHHFLDLRLLIVGITAGSAATSCMCLDSAQQCSLFLTPLARLQELEQLYEQLVAVVREQRSSHTDDWKPQARHLNAVAKAGRGSDWSWLRIGATMAVLVAGLSVAYRYYKRK